MRKVILCFLFVLILSSCRKLFLGEDQPNNPEQNFDLFWNDFDKHYALFAIKGTNWDSLYQVYRPQVNSTTTDQQLWNILSQLIEHLNDSHTAIYTENYGRYYESGFELGRKAIDEEFSLNLIRSKFVENFTKTPGEADLSYGKLRNRNIGYIFLREEEGENPERAIGEIIGKLKNMDAIIFDIRTNSGGDARYSKIIAGSFSDGEHLIATVQTRNGPNHTDFNQKVNEVTQKTGAVQYVKPVVLLTDRATMSGGEYLTLHLKSFKHVTHIGDTTAGDFSATSMRRFLPNGWVYRFSIQLFLLPDGISLDGKGIAPDIYIKNRKDDIAEGNDRVLERAIQYLAEEKGIK
ncbi:S41 family peptidase [Rubrolithibacter danxiaensis]|uniref:S41 family peptidase n=1 Tax=Rubrolithibacter danxiaensis TaxID=3390805 RepID=UPI003BF8EC8D